MLLHELDYDLPEELIATRAVEPRDAARMLVAQRSDDRVLLHRHVRDLPQILRAGDLLVLNTSRVIPAWLEGHRVGTGGRFTGLYLGVASGAWGEGRGQEPGAEPNPLRLDAARLTPDPPPASHPDPEPRGRPVALWRVLLRGGHLRPGAVLRVEGAEGGEPLEGQDATPGDQAPRPSLDAPHSPDTGVRLQLLAKDDEEPGGWIVRVFADGPAGSEALLERIGRTPIPPYIRAARRHAGLAIPDSEDRARYQTLFAAAQAGPDPVGSVAAPTAGLHLTAGLLGSLRAHGIGRADVSLHVGSGTFRPVESPVVEEHPMHSERCGMTRGTREAILRARAAGGRVICVGTTSARTLETFAQREEGGLGYEEWVETRMLITPGYRWRCVDGLLTNFHLPRSTLLAMVAAMFRGGMERARTIYAEAIRERYRFFSYGDAMLVMP